MVDSEKKLGLAGSPAVAVNIELMNWPFKSSSYQIMDWMLHNAYDVKDQ